MTLKVYCCYTKAHEVLLEDFFLPSMPCDVRVVAIPLDIKGDGDFLSPEFLHCIKKKISLIQKSLEQENNSIIVWSDIDIIFFRDFAREVVRLMNSGGYDIAFQKEGFGDLNDDVNAGFIVMRCNDRVREFYHQVADELEAHPDKNEQPVINELLANQPDLNWSMLPLHFAAKSHCWPPAEDLLLYHANVTMGENGVQQKIEQFKEVRRIRNESPLKICVVSPEVVGPRKNSGIGTHAYHFLKLLSSDPNVDVTFLLTGEIHVESEEYWKSRFREEMNVNFIHLHPLPHPYPLVGWFNQWFNLRSLQVFHFLRRQNFKVIHFQDLNADGFICHQARRTGLAFQNTVFTTMVNGPAIWAREGMKQFAGDIVYESLLNFAESYPISRTDILISPSKYAFDYLTTQCEWDLAGKRKICPYMLDIENRSGDLPVQDPAIIFFSRLETRKGIHLFLKSLVFLQREDIGGIPQKVIFIGSHGLMPEGRSNELIPGFFKDNLPDWEYEIHSHWDQPECIDYLATHKRSVVVLPSIAETLGYVAIECLELGLNVIGARTGAYPEVFSTEDRLFENNPRAIAVKIREAFNGGLSEPSSHYDSREAKVKWMNVHHESIELARKMNENIDCSIPDSPLVSVCLSYFNYGNYIDEQVNSLVNQSYNNWEIIFINDGSTDQVSQEVFERLKHQYCDDRRFRFLDQSNQGLCVTRNRAADLARGEYLVFCDADNISKPAMLERLVEAIQLSNADCVTSHFEKFRIDDDGNRLQLDYYTPLGACVEAGPFVDPYGDVNAIIRKSVFIELGGFRHVPNTASEDWEFFSELCLSGYKLEVVPADLFEYREHSASNMRNTSFYDTRCRTLYPYLRRMNKWQQNILVGAMGSYENNLRSNRKVSEKIRQLEESLQQAKQSESEAVKSLSEVTENYKSARKELESAKTEVESLKCKPDGRQEEIEISKRGFLGKISDWIKKR